MQTPDPVSNPSDKAIFHFGPYVPILRKKDGVVFDYGGALDYHSTDVIERDLLPDDAIVDAPSLVTPLLLKKKTRWPPREAGETRNTKDIDAYVKSTTIVSLTNANKDINGTILSIQDYYKSSAGDLLFGIGLSQVTEYNLAEKVRRLAAKLRRSENESIDCSDLEESRIQLAQIKANNQVYKPTQLHRCHLCPFRTESSLVLENHLETPHCIRKEYFCNWCNFKSKDVSQTLIHNLVEHKKRCRVEKAMAPHLCTYCSFECQSKRMMTSHLTKCERKFSHKAFLGPQEFGGNDYPTVTSKLITQEDIAAYERSLRTLRLAAYNPHQITIAQTASVNPLPVLVVARPVPPSTSNRTTQLNPFECFVQKNTNTRPVDNTLIGKNPFGPTINLLGSNQARIITQTRGSNNSALVFNLLSAHHTAPNKKIASPLQSPRTQSPFVNGKSVSINASDIIMTPQQPKQSVEVITLDDEDEDDDDDQEEAQLAQDVSDNPKSTTFVICEICDGYIKDLNQLKVHMQWTHKVRLHQKTLSSKPPLNCQKCQWRFFTDQGLERHLLGAHGLVTSNMQEQVDKGTDSGRCTVCGRAFANNLVTHMKEIHRSSLKPAHLSYKCTVCSATFNLYRLFENHVYRVHNDLVERATSK